MANDVDNSGACGKRGEKAEPQLSRMPFIRVGSAASETRFILPSGVHFLSSSEVNGNGSGLRHF